MTLISGLVEKAFAILVVLAALLLGFMRCQELAAERDAARAANAVDQVALTELRQANAQNLDALAKLKADVDRAAATQAASVADAQARADELTRTERMIAHAPPVDRGAVPRVVLHAIDGLLQPAAADPGARHQDRRGAAAAAAGAP